MSERFLYEIRPNRPINFPGVGRTVRTQSALLTKEEVLDYMKYGPVYRKYVEANVPPVRVTGANINLLHQPYKVEQQSNRSVTDIIPNNDINIVTKEIKPQMVVFEEQPKKSIEDESINQLPQLSIEKIDLDDESSNDINTNTEKQSDEELVINEPESSTIMEVEPVESVNNDTGIDETNQETDVDVIEPEVVVETVEEESENNNNIAQTGAQSKATDSNSNSYEKHNNYARNNNYKNVQFNSGKKKH